MPADALPYGPDHLLRASYGCLVLWPVDSAGSPLSATEVILTRSVRPLAFAPSAERRVTGNGTLDERARVHPLTPEIVGWPEIARLRAWKAEGYKIKGRVLAAGRGRHILWDAPVSVVLDAFSEGRPSLEGDRLTMESHLFSPAITTSPDLLALSPWDDEDDVAFVTLPAPGVRVFAYTPAAYADGGAVVAGEITIQAYAFDGTTLLGENTDVLPTLVLPPGTWIVSVVGAALTAPSGESVRPVLSTRPASSFYGEGGYLLTNPEAYLADGAELEGYSRGTVTEGTTEITINGSPQTVASVDIGDAHTVSIRTSRPTPDGPLAVEVIPTD